MNVCLNLDAKRRELYVLNLKPLLRIMCLSVFASVLAAKWMNCFKAVSFYLNVR